MKRVKGYLLALIVCLGMFAFTACAEQKSDAFEMYQAAMQATVKSGSWTEDLTMTADMALESGGTKVKATIDFNSLVDVSNYSESDPSAVRMSGSASMSVMGQTYAWNIEYENGIAHYEYTEPMQTSADIEMDPSCYNFDTLTADMLENAKVSGNQISFTIPGAEMETARVAAMDMMSGFEDLEYGDVDVKITIDESTGAIDAIIMTFHASLTYMGYDAEVDYSIDYRFAA